MTTWGVQNCQHSNKEEKSQRVDVKAVERERDVIIPRGASQYDLT